MIFLDRGIVTAFTESYSRVEPTRDFSQEPYRPGTSGFETRPVYFLTWIRVHLPFVRVYPNNMTDS